MTLYKPSLPEQRRPLLAAALREGRLLQAIECHNPISAMVAAAAREVTSKGPVMFDALWASGFAHATAMGLPDAELSLLERRIDFIGDIAAVSSLPIIADGDTGGDELAFALLCQRLETMGVSAVIVEDKAGAKRTSLAESVQHQMEDPHVFVEKIRLAKSAVLSQDFLIFARIESLIAGLDMQEALRRAKLYLQSSADAVVIHSKDKTGGEIFSFMEGYRGLQAQLGIKKPLVLIPTAYNHVTGQELQQRGAQLVIHGNHLIRAAFSAMRHAAQSVLKHDRSREADLICAPVSELIDAVGIDFQREAARG